MAVVLDHTFLGRVGEPWIEFFRAVSNCTAPGVQECCSGSFVLPCRTCCCSHMEIQQWNVAQVLQPCSDTWAEPLQIPHRVPSASPFPSLWILCWCRPGHGLGFSVFTLNPCAQAGAGFLVSRISPTLPRVPFPMGSEVLWQYCHCW